MKLTKPRNFRRNAVTGSFDQLLLATVEDNHDSCLLFIEKDLGSRTEQMVDFRHPTLLILCISLPPTVQR